MQSAIARALSIILSMLIAIGADAQEDGKQYYDRVMEMRNQSSDKYKKMLHLLEKSSDLGYIPANAQLYYYYSSGIYNSFPPDKQKAFEYIRRAAVANDSQGVMVVAASYATGFGTTPDPARAIEWYKKAADGGNATAMKKLAEMYAHQGDAFYSPRDYWVWMGRASAAGDLESAKIWAIAHKDCAAIAKVAGRYATERNEKFEAKEINLKGSELGCAQCSYGVYQYFSHSEGYERSALDYLEKAKAQGYDVAVGETDHAQQHIADAKEKDRREMQEALKKPYPGYINANAPGVRNGGSPANNRTTARGERKCPFCSGAGQVKVEGLKGSYTDNFGHQHSTYDALHWVSCSHCNGTGYVSQ